MTISPVISIIIPTVGRSDQIVRAVESALSGMDPDAAEVIVVRNGVRTERQSPGIPALQRPEVTLIDVDRQHASTARNRGLEAARGRYVRFLDDDDYLYPQAAVQQYRDLDRSGADVCSGAFDVVGTHGAHLYTVEQLPTDDLLEGTLGRRGMWQPTAHVFRRSTIERLRWNEQLPYCQDFDWMLRVARCTPISWVRCAQTVGAWHRHTASRISLHSHPNDKQRLIAATVLEAVAELESAGTLTPARRRAAATCLWNCVHVALCHEPRYWTQIARRARQLSADSVPAIPFYTRPRRFPWRPPPLIWEWLMLPKRRAQWHAQQLMLAAGLARRG